MKALSLYPMRVLITLVCLAPSFSTAADVTYEAVAAKYSTQSCTLPCGEPQDSEWHLWRAENRVEIRAANGHTGELWQRDAKGLVSFTYLEPAQKRGIEYNATDLRVTGNGRDWARLASIVSPKELEQLTLLGETEFLGHPALSYKGKLGERELEVTWIPKLQLAVRVVATNGQRQSVTELKAFLGNSEPGLSATPADLSQYQLIDFADIGDMETNPTMAWLKQARVPGHEQHEH